MSRPLPPYICYLCLSSNRLTYSVSERVKPLFDFVTSLYYHVDAKVCWECNAIMEKFSCFKERAERAMRELEEARRSMKPMKFSSLSKLEKSGLVIVDLLVMKISESKQKKSKTMQNMLTFRTPNRETNKKKTHSKVNREDEHVISIDNDVGVKCILEELNNDKIVDKSNSSSDDEILKDTKLKVDKLRNVKEVDSYDDRVATDFASDSEKEQDDIRHTKLPLEILFVDAPNDLDETDKTHIKPSHNNLKDAKPNAQTTPLKTDLTVPKFIMNEPVVPILIGENNETLSYFMVNTPSKTDSKPGLNVLKVDRKRVTRKKRAATIKADRNTQMVNYAQNKKVLKIYSKIVDKQLTTANNKKVRKEPECQIPEISYATAIEDSITEGRCERYRGSLADVQSMRERRRGTTLGKSVCVQCIENFRTPEALYQHISSRHFKTGGQLVCEICSCRFADEDKFSEHVDSHYAMYRCTVAGCKFVETCMIRTQRHITTAHGDLGSDEKTVNKCKFCGGQFHSREYYLRHLQRHTSQQKYTCDICQREYDSRAQIHLHMRRSHRENPPRICEVCGKSVTQYKDHLRVHGIFRCWKCKVDFGSKEDWSKHMSTHKTGAHKCDICGEKFNNLVQKDIHVKKHSDPNPYVCEECGARFPMKYKLTEHSYCHVTDKKHVCSVCDKSFMFKSKLMTHMKTHFKADPNCSSPIRPGPALTSYTIQSPF